MKMKHYLPETLGHSKGRAEREVYSFENIYKTTDYK
jgi:hypothetical protein